MLVHVPIFPCHVQRWMYGKEGGRSHLSLPSLWLRQRAANVWAQCHLLFFFFFFCLCPPSSATTYDSAPRAPDAIHATNAFVHVQFARQQACRCPPASHHDNPLTSSMLRLHRYPRTQEERWWATGGRQRGGGGKRRRPAHHHPSV